jgi:hypothetical protein
MQCSWRAGVEEIQSRDQVREARARFKKDLLTHGKKPLFITRK